ncbi:MAG TPA: hypothetical protein VFU73_09825 [Actinocrinis sp.]|nr:hypothetical protein [Actinocrinis sp.]
MHTSPSPDPGPDALAAHLTTTLPVLPGFDELGFEHLSAAGRIDALTACVRLVHASTDQRDIPTRANG